ncbi:hypothetical protein PV325_010912 [Microctonus aethiopoides]|nr:hypothetical protein PV325_010912 [Microctonus aethiopoides]
MIVKDLSREEKKFLEFVPPHAHDYDEILIKNFGNRTSPEEDINEYGRKVCPRCECVKKSDVTIIRMMENLIYFANQLKSRLRSMTSKVEELSGEKLVNNAVNDDDEDDEGHDAAGNESPMSLQDVKQKQMEEKNSDINNQEAPTTANAVTNG